MDTVDLLSQAIQAARNGRELTARDLFQQVVRIDPSNEVAWMWLSGLLDDLEDRIKACEMVLSINPENQKIEVYLDDLLSKQKIANQQKYSKVDEALVQVRSYIKDGQRMEALLLLQNTLHEEDRHMGAWLLYANLSVNINDKVSAYEAILRINPSDEIAQENLKQHKYFQRNPLELAKQYEEEGKTEKAVELYRILAAEAGNSPEFDRIYKNIVRLEDTKTENIRHIRPALNILRLSFGIPILYLLEIFIQEGLNPIKNPALDFWIGIPIVIIGGFMIAVSGATSNHNIWRELFGEQAGRASSSARILVGISGWLMVFAPQMMLVLDSITRLQHFQIPPLP